jgi:hypothetical protein
MIRKSDQAEEAETKVANKVRCEQGMFFSPECKKNWLDRQKYYVDFGRNYTKTTEKF